MFLYLGNFVSRTWPLLLLGWILLLAGTWALAPEWDDVVDDGEFVFLPEDVPSRRGERLFEQAFPAALTGSSVIIVLRRDEEGGLREGDRQFIEEILRPRLERMAREPDRPEQPASLITGIRTFQDDTIASLLVSDDQRASLVVVELETEFLEYRNWATIERIEGLMEDLHRQQAVPSGLEIGLTGNAMVGRDLTRAEAESADATEIWAVTLIILLLVLVYRAPLLALIPLLTLVFAVEISLRLLAVLSGMGVIGLFQGIQVYATVIVYGAGVDYSLFLSARYKEELDKGADFRDGLAQALAKVGPAVTASAGTEIFGIGMMAFAAFGKFHQAGISVAFGLFITLCAALTLTPALLRLTGRWAFWPRRRFGPAKDEPNATPAERWLDRLMGQARFQKTWETLGRLLQKRPGTIWLGTVAALAPFALIAVLFYNHLSFGMLEELPRDVPSVAGTALLQEHFPAGTIAPITLLVRNDAVDFSTSQGVGMIEELTNRLQAREGELEIADIRSVADPLGMAAPPDEMTAEDPLAARLLRRGVMRRRAIEHYVSGADEWDRHVTRVELVVRRDPLSRQSINHLNRIERAIEAEFPDAYREDTRLHLIGATASLRDLLAVAEHDRVRISILVTATVLAVLIVLLRRIAIPVYLVLSVLGNYLATLGVTFTVFWLLDPHGFPGLHWTVPLFLFTVLIAVSEDYNIFLVTRIDEEQERHGAVPGITVALSRVARIIAGCGIIMAGTFSSLLFGGELARMYQLGFALAFGLLLQTFVVMPILVPTFLILVNRGRFGAFGKYLGARRLDAPQE